jgi:hypothetical protein
LTLLHFAVSRQNRSSGTHRHDVLTMAFVEQFDQLRRSELRVSSLQSQKLVNQLLPSRVRTVLRPT